MSLTKQDIDALSEELVKSGAVERDWLSEFSAKLYLAAGLPAEGERKPERTRVWRGTSNWTGVFVWFTEEPKPREFELRELTPGWFVPDGAE